MKYDFTKMSKQDVFKAKLAHDMIPFDFIPYWRRKRFLKFCIENELITQPRDWLPYAYLVNHKFSYVTSFSKVRHLPFGKILEFISDIFYAYPNHYSALRCYVQRTYLEAKPRKNNAHKGMIEIAWQNKLLR